MIATPCYGGMATVPYMESVLNLSEALLTVGMKFDFLFTKNESLIPRARNTSAATFLSSDYEYLMFIDSDIEFTPEDVSKLWNLQTDVAVGAYSMKRPDKPVSAWKDGELVSLDSLSSPVPVDYAGTGFMMIKRSVFEQLQKYHPNWRYEEGHVGESWGFFQDPIEDGIHLSEDYFFCKRCREIGIEITLDPSIKLGHYGSYRYG